MEFGISPNLISSSIISSLFLSGLWTNLCASWWPPQLVLALLVDGLSLAARLSALVPAIL
jgi:hypothetical protein